jgi:hypothetical protein
LWAARTFERFGGGGHSLSRRGLAREKSKPGYAAIDADAVDRELAYYLIHRLKADGDPGIAAFKNWIWH